ncbi:hypothetical protein SPV_2516 [Streptococcus pneumoniae]|nr:hypothetical protein SPV_2516 [Streptococcus pneumoniae]
MNLLSRTLKCKGEEARNSLK